MSPQSLLKLLLQPLIAVDETKSLERTSNPQQFKPSNKSLRLKNRIVNLNQKFNHQMLILVNNQVRFTNSNLIERQVVGSTRLLQNQESQSASMVWDKLKLLKTRLM